MAITRIWLAAPAAALLLIATVGAVLLTPCGAAHAQEAAVPALGFSVGKIDVDRAINLSESGERSVKVLRAAAAQKESELKAKEAELKKLAEDLRSNIMLTEAAKDQKRQELQTKDNELRNQVANAQRELQEQERKFTDGIFNELKPVIAIVAKEHNMDVVLEIRAANTILYSRFKIADITDEVVARYNKIQSGK